VAAQLACFATTDFKEGVRALAAPLRRCGWR